MQLAQPTRTQIKTANPGAILQDDVEMAGLSIGVDPTEHRNFENFLEIPEGLNQALVNVRQLLLGCVPRGLDGDHPGSSNTLATRVMVPSQEQFCHLLWSANCCPGVQSINEFTDLFRVGIIRDSRRDIAGGTQIDDGKWSVHGHRAFTCLTA